MKKVLNAALKIALGLLILHIIFYADLPQYKDKAIALRVVFYPLAAMLTYLVVRFVLPASRRPKQYPYFIDYCLTGVVAFDLLGNTLGLYDSIVWWDDLMHLMLSIPWVMVAGYMLRNRKFAPWVIAGLVIAYGSTSHIIWELLEYQSFVRSHPVESLSAYRDTMGDLTLALIGTFIGAWLTVKLLRATTSKSG
jgi:hypothetical protein